MVDKRGLVDRVVNKIGREIVSGLLKPRQTLPNEADLGGQLGISRPVLREAVRVLVSKGLLQTRSRLGTRLREPDAWSQGGADAESGAVAARTAAGDAAAWRRSRGNP